jgi:hypothetical protein
MDGTMGRVTSWEANHLRSLAAPTNGTGLWVEAFPSSYGGGLTPGDFGFHWIAFIPGASPSSWLVFEIPSTLESPCWNEDAEQVVAVTWREVGRSVVTSLWTYDTFSKVVTTHENLARHVMRPCLQDSKLVYLCSSSPEVLVRAGETSTAIYPLGASVEKCLI